MTAETQETGETIESVETVETVETVVTDEIATIVETAETAQMHRLIHTSYLSFLLHGQDFENQILHPKKTTKDTKNTKNISEKVKCMQFFHPIWKNLHLTENFYTGIARGARDKYEVCLGPIKKFVCLWRNLWRFCG